MAVAALGVDVAQVKASAEAYYAKHQIRPLLTRLLVSLGRDQPDDPIDAIRQLLLTEAKTPINFGDFAHTKLEDDAPVIAATAVEAVPGEEKPAANAPLETDTGEERDTDAPVEMDPLQLLITEKLHKHGKGSELDAGSAILSTRAFWAGGFNRLLFEGWVPQPSPCCGAASVAGAFNALWEQGRNCDAASSVREVADLMALNCDKLRAQKQSRIERLLGIEEGALDELAAAVDAHLQESGLTWTGRGEQAITKKAVMPAIREVVKAAVPTEARLPDVSPASASGDQAVPLVDVFAALREALGDSTEEATTTEDAAAIVEAADGEVQVSVSQEPQGDDAGAEKPVKSNGGVLVEFSNAPNWAQELRDFFSKRKGVLRLRQEKPNTSEIGSWGIKQAAESLASAREVDPIKVRTLVGRRGSGKGLVVPISVDDKEDSIVQQWTTLKAAFGSPNSVLLFHLTNHYALVYAWREWLEAPDPDAEESVKMRRQILTSRRGQRPSAWLDFTEVRSTILGWSGYHILHLERLVNKAAKQAVDPPCETPPSEAPPCETPA